MVLDVPFARSVYRKRKLINLWMTKSFTKKPYYTDSFLESDEPKANRLLNDLQIVFEKLLKLMRLIVPNLEWIYINTMHEWMTDVSFPRRWFSECGQWKPLCGNYSFKGFSHLYAKHFIWFSNEISKKTKEITRERMYIWQVCAYGWISN